mmetsp:Transcript_4565/g.14979  ORF Transcript_4565/g.14979 Transcript_4565/m.14979 type:complete len:252 (-) Transcript_4565:635-1390(-)
MPSLSGEGKEARSGEDDPLGGPAASPSVSAEASRRRRADSRAAADAASHSASEPMAPAPGAGAAGPASIESIRARTASPSLRDELAGDGAPLPEASLAPEGPRLAPLARGPPLAALAASRASEDPAAAFHTNLISSSRRRCSLESLPLCLLARCWHTQCPSCLFSPQFCGTMQCPKRDLKLCSCSYLWCHLRRGPLRKVASHVNSSLLSHISCPWEIFPLRRSARRVWTHSARDGFSGHAVGTRVCPCWSL